MSTRCFLILGSLLPPLLMVGVARAAAQASAAPAPSEAAAVRDAAAVQEEMEEVLLLEALRTLRLTDVQRAEVLPLARGVRERLRQAEAEEARRLLALKETVAATRLRLLGGESVPVTTQEQLRLAREAANQRRSRLEADLVRTTSDRLARILTPPQMEVVYSLSRGVNLSQRIASPLLQSGAMDGLRAGRPPEEEFARQRRGIEEDVYDWRKDGHKDERNDLIREMTRGIPRDTPQYQQASAQAGLFIDQLKAMPEAAFQQQVNDLVDRLTRNSIAGRQQEDRAKFQAAQAPGQRAEWLTPFVRRVFFSPRIVPVLEAQVGQPSGAASAR